MVLEEHPPLEPETTIIPSGKVDRATPSSLGLSQPWYPNRHRTWEWRCAIYFLYGVINAPFQLDDEPNLYMGNGC